MPADATPRSTKAKRTGCCWFRSRPSDEDAEITKLKDGRTALAYKAENATVFGKLPNPITVIGGYEKPDRDKD